MQENVKKRKLGPGKFGKKLRKINLKTLDKFGNVGRYHRHLQHLEA